jgi:peptidoglycan LD-endopeptidase CwlK
MLDLIARFFGRARATAPARATVVNEPKPAKPTPPSIDERSRRIVAKLHPAVQAKFESFIRAAKYMAHESGYDVKAISGLRTFDEQDALYAKGRTTPGPKVTNAKAGYSNHNFGLAIDIGVFSKDGKKYHGEHPLYTELGPLGESLGLEWGGRWKFRDEPHYQFRPAWAADISEREMLTGLRSRVRSERDILRA